MNIEVFTGLPDESRVWVQPFHEPLDAAQETRVRRTFEAFIPQWTSHREPVRAAFEVVESRFLITAAFVSGGISGCSTDGLFRIFKQWKDAGTLDCLDGSLVFWRDGTGRIRCSSHLEFFDQVGGGAVQAETVVFDTLIANLGELRQGRFERAFRDSWHWQTYARVSGLPASAGGRSAAAPARIEGPN